MTERTDLEVAGWSHPATDTWIVHFRWEKNPLPMNGSHGHPMAHAKKVRQTRDHARYAIRAAHIPPLGRCEALVTWWVSTDRVRDLDNLAELEKRLFDALVLEHVVADDNPALMTKPRGQIRRVEEGAGLVTEPGFTLHVHRLEIGEAD